MILTPLQLLPKNGEDWGKLIVAKGFKKLPKVQNIAQSGHTAPAPLSSWGAAIAQWICMRLSSCCLGFKSRARYRCFYQFTFELYNLENRKMNITRGVGDWPILN